MGSLRGVEQYGGLTFKGIKDGVCRQLRRLFDQIVHSLERARCGGKSGAEKFQVAIRRLDDKASWGVNVAPVQYARVR